MMTMIKMNWKEETTLLGIITICQIARKIKIFSVKIINLIPNWDKIIFSINWII